MRGKLAPRVRPCLTPMDRLSNHSTKSSDRKAMRPEKWGWGTWLVVDIAAGLAIVALLMIFG